MSRIFVVDSDRPLLTLLETALPPLGHRVGCADHYANALQEIRQFAPDFVVLGIMLSDGYGYQLSRALRSDSKLYMTPILFMSVFSQQPEIEYALEQGGDAYLTKPFSLDDLMGRLQQMELLVTRIVTKSPETGMPGLAATQKEIEYRIFRNRPFSLCYVSLDGFESFVLDKGHDQAVKVLRWMGKILQQSIRDRNLYDAYLAHLGREHFFVLLDPQEYGGYCRAVDLNFSIGSSFLANDNSMSKTAPSHVQNDTSMRQDGLALRIDVAVWKDRSFARARDMFRQLEEARKQPEGGGQKTLFRWEMQRKK